MHRIGGTTAVFGVIGDPIGHTLSPLMQNRALEIMDIDGVYVAFPVSSGELEDAVRAVRALHIRGLNVTVPHKTAVMPYLDHLSDAARAVGAVNTIINDERGLTGDNTDVYGFEQCVLREGGVDRFPARICVLGAGGAARGVVYACAVREEVEEIVILNRTLSRAREIADDIGMFSGRRISAAPLDTETQRAVIPEMGMIVNATSMGMASDAVNTPVSIPDAFQPGQLVCDIIYTPLRTRLLEEAAARGARTIGGLAMLAYQGARSLSLWTGREAPADAMLDVLREKFRVM